MLKDTALGYIITYPELLQSAERLSARFGNLFVAYIVVALIFIAINWALSVLATKIEGYVATRQAGEVVTGIPPMATMAPVEPSPDENPALYP